MRSLRERASAWMTLALNLIIGTSFLGLAALSMADGVMEVTVTGRIPDLARELHRPVADLALIVGAFPFGLLLGALISMYMLYRWGTKSCLISGSLMFFGPLVAISYVVELPGDYRLQLIAALWLVGGIGCGVINPALQAKAKAFPRPGDWVAAFMIFKVVGFASGSLFGAAAIHFALDVATHFRWIGWPVLVVGLVAACAMKNIKRTVESGATPISGWGLLGLGIMAAVVAIVLGGSIGWATAMFEELGVPDGLTGWGLAAFCLTQSFALGLTIRKEPSARRLARLSVVLASAGIGLLACAIVAKWHGILAAEGRFAIATAGLALLGAITAPMLSRVINATGSVTWRQLSGAVCIGLVVSVQYVVQGGMGFVIGWLGGRVEQHVGGLGISVVYAIVCLAFPIAVLCLQRLLRYADQPEAPEPPARIVALKPRSFGWFEQPSLESFVDADVTGARDEVLTAFGSLLEQRTGARPDAFLVRVVSALAPRPGEVGRFGRIGVKARLAADVAVIPGIGEVRDVRVQDGLADGPTAIVTVELRKGASLEQLREHTRFVAAKFAAVAPIDGEPFARVVLAVRVECASVEWKLGVDPLVDVGLGADTPALSQPYDVGRELASLWEHRTLAGVRVVLAERETLGAKGDDAALFVHHAAIGAHQLGGARPEGETSTFEGGVFVPVAVQDAAAADRSADLLSGVLRSVGTVALGVRVRVAPTVRAASPS